jgi:hypothetical protein
VDGNVAVYVLQKKVVSEVMRASQKVYWEAVGMKIEDLLCPRTYRLFHLFIVGSATTTS